MSDVLAVLWQISWHATLAVAVVLVARLAFGPALPGRWRHALWLVVLCRLLMPVAPQSRLSAFGLLDRPAPPPPAVVAGPTFTVSVATPVATPADVGPEPAMSTPLPVATPRWPLLLTVTWLTVAAGLVVRLVVVNVRFNRALDRAAGPIDPRLSAAFDAARREMRGGGRATLAVTDVVSTPAACGVWRPRVLLPTGLAGSLSDERLRLVFLHELAHVRSRDVAVDWVWAVVQSAYWFNPVLWLVGPLRRHDRELARDEAVLSLAGPAQAEAYGRTLLTLARPGGLPALCPGLVGLFDGRGLRGRVARVARLKAGRAGSAWVGAAVLAVAGCASLTNPPPPRQQATTAPAAAGPVADAQPAADPDAPSPAAAATLAKLDRTLPQVRFNGNALSDVFDYLRDQTGTNIYVDWHALEAAGIPRTSPVTARLRDVKASKALELVFMSVEGDDDDHKLGYAVDDGVITISTHRELDKNVVTRRYDINDLLFVPPDYDTVNGRPADAAAREQRVAEVKQYVQQNVAPNSWKDNGGAVGSITSSSLRAVLLITQTPENQRKVRAVLDSLRASQSLQVSVEARIVTVEDADVGRLPEGVRQLLGLTAGGPVGTPTLSADQVGAINGAAAVESAMVPRLTMFSGQRGAVSAMAERAVVSGYTAVVRPDGGGTAYEPIQRTVATGLAFDVQATVAPDRRHVFVDLHPVLTRMGGVAGEHWGGAPATAAVMVQRPVVLTSATRTSCVVQDGATLLMGCGPFAADPAGPTVTDPAVAAAVERAKRAHVFLLVRPTILEVTAQRTFPRLDTPVR